MTNMSRIRAHRWFLYFLVIAAITAAIYVARTFALQQAIPSFNPPGCILPCIAGVIPGKTDISQAAAIINSVLPNKLYFISDSGLSFQESPNGHEVHLDFDGIDPREGRYVKQIQASTDGKSKLTTLGAMITAGFVPTRVFRSKVSGPDSINLLIVFGTDQQIIAYVGATKRVSPDTPIENLITTAKESWILDDVRMTSHFEDEITWLGFAPIDTYWNASPINNS
jgi:hypothetical protein